MIAMDAFGQLLLGATTGIFTGGTVAPEANETYDLGYTNIRWNRTFTRTLNLKEQPPPGAPAADCAHLWIEDNGAGKSRLMVQFATGAAIQLAIQP
jgi:hypothetical protein